MKYVLKSKNLSSEVKIDIDLDNEQQKQTAGYLQSTGIFGIFDENNKELNDKEVFDILGNYISKTTSMNLNEFVDYLQLDSDKFEERLEKTLDECLEDKLVQKVLLENLDYYYPNITENIDNIVDEVYDEISALFEMRKVKSYEEMWDVYKKYNPNTKYFYPKGYENCEDVHKLLQETFNFKLHITLTGQELRTYLETELEKIFNDIKVYIIESKDDMFNNFKVCEYSSHETRYLAALLLENRLATIREDDDDWGYKYDPNDEGKKITIAPSSLKDEIDDEIADMLGDALVVCDTRSVPDIINAVGLDDAYLKSKSKSIEEKAIATLRLMKKGYQPDDGYNNNVIDEKWQATGIESPEEIAWRENN